MICVMKQPMSQNIYMRANIRLLIVCLSSVCFCRFFVYCIDVCRVVTGNTIEPSQAGGVGQIRPCPRPLQEYVSLMTDLMALDTESGRLIKKTRFGEDGGGGAGSGGSSGAAGSGGAGSGGGSGSSSPVKASRRKPRSGWYFAGILLTPGPPRPHAYLKRYLVFAS